MELTFTTEPNADQREKINIFLQQGNLGVRAQYLDEARYRFYARSIAVRADGLFIWGWYKIDAGAHVNWASLDELRIDNYTLTPLSGVN